MPVTCSNLMLSHRARFSSVCSVCDAESLFFVALWIRG